MAGRLKETLQIMGAIFFIPYNENYNETGNKIAQGNSLKIAFN